MENPPSGAKRSVLLFLSGTALVLLCGTAAGLYLGWRWGAEIGIQSAGDLVEPVAEAARLALDVDRFVTDCRLSVNRSLGREGPLPGDADRLLGRSRDLAGRVPETSLGETVGGLGRQSAEVLGHVATALAQLQELESQHQRALDDLNQMAKRVELDESDLRTALTLSRCQNVLLRLKIDRLEWGQVLPIETLAGGELENRAPSLFAVLRDALEELRSAAPGIAADASQLLQWSFGYEVELIELYVVLSADVAPLMASLQQGEASARTQVRALEAQVETAVDEAQRRAREALHIRRQE